MAKVTGLGDSLYIGAIDASGDVGAVGTIHGGPAAMDVTGINSAAFERVGGRRSGEISFTSWYNSTGAFTTLNDLPTADVGVTYAHRGVLGNPICTLLGKQINYDPTYGNDGSLSFAVQALSNGSMNGLEWGVQLTAGQRTDTAGTNPTSGVDDLGGSPTSTAFGASIWVHLLTFAGSNITFTLRDAATEPTYAAVTGGASAAMTAVGYQRWTTSASQTIRRFLTIGTSGTFSNAVFVVGVTRHLVATL